MPRKIRQVYTNFSSGEINNLLNARTDAKAYFEGGKQVRNWYLLDEGGVFDSLAERTVTLFKHHMLAEMGQLSRAAAHDPENITDPVAAGISASEEILKGLGMKKPPAILQYKMAQALGRMADGAGAASTAPNFDPSADFYKQ